MDLTFGVVVVAALIDSINPCAIGVLLFLMAVLLSMGSAKRALRAGLIYSFVIFVVYLAAGFGIMRLIGVFDILDTVRIVAGALILIGGLIEIKDYFWEDRGFSLKIPSGTKPVLEKLIRKGTLPAIVVLGVLVALVELPCTGGIYLGILGLISDGGSLGTLYLVVYNLVFILPLILITWLVARGTKVDAVNGWVQRNKKYMRLAAGVIMVALALVLLGVI
jgi:cytochrome c biogenesis protein CcdA